MRRVRLSRQATWLAALPVVLGLASLSAVLVLALEPPPGDLPAAAEVLAGRAPLAPHAPAVAEALAPPPPDAAAVGSEAAVAAADSGSVHVAEHEDERGADALADLLRLAESPSPEDRQEAAAGLAAWGADEAARRLLAHLLRDAEAPVAAAAARSLRALPDGERLLAHRLAETAEVDVGILACLEALAEVGTAADLPVVVAWLDRPEAAPQAADAARRICAREEIEPPSELPQDDVERELEAWAAGVDPST